MGAFFIENWEAIVTGIFFLVGGPPLAVVAKKGIMAGKIVKVQAGIIQDLIEDTAIPQIDPDMIKDRVSFLANDAAKSLKDAKSLEDAVNKVQDSLWTNIGIKDSNG